MNTWVRAVGPAHSLCSAMSELTTINVRPEQLEAIDDAGENIFGVSGISKQAIIDRLLSDHPDVEYHAP